MEGALGCYEDIGRGLEGGNGEAIGISSSYDYDQYFIFYRLEG